MKIKYYLRGVGTGIVITAVLMALAAGGNKPISDDEIRARALKLGMVAADNTLAGKGSQESQESQSSQSSEAAESQATKESVESQESQESQSVETGESQETKESQESQSSQTEETVESQESQESQESSASQSEESKESAASQSEESKESGASQSEESKESGASQPDESKESLTGEVYSLTIKKGYSSNTVAKILADAGIVESAAQYDAYLCSHGYDKRICVGVFEIPAGSSEEEIAKIITKSK